MIKVVNAQREKERFKRIFKDCSSVSLAIIATGHTMRLRLSNDKVEFNTDLCFDYTSELRYSVFLPFLNVTDCVFDLLFDKDGFIIEPYKVAYTDLVVISKKTNTEGYISQVVFKTKRKTTSFVVPCNQYTNMLQENNI